MGQRRHDEPVPGLGQNLHRRLEARTEMAAGRVLHVARVPSGESVSNMVRPRPGEKAVLHIRMMLHSILLLLKRKQLILRLPAPTGAATPVSYPIPQD